MAFLADLPEIRRPVPGVELLLLPERRFKRALLDIHFDRPLDQRSPARTLLCQVLEHGSRRHPSRMVRLRALEELFGASVSLDGDRLAEMHRLTLGLSWVGESFLPAGARVTEGVLALGREQLEEPLRGSAGEPFPATTFTREQEQLLRRIRTLQEDRSAYAHERFLAAMCQDEPYGRPPYGSEAEAAALVPEELEAARVEMLEHAPVTAVGVGPFDPERIEQELAAWFGADGAHAQGDREPPPEPVRKEPERVRELRESLPVDQARFLFGFRFPPPATAEEVEALTLANSLLGGGSHGRLFRVVREQKSQAYGIYSLLRTRKGILTVEAGIDEDSYEEVRDEVLQQIEVLVRGEYAKEELEMARASILNDLQGLADSAGALVHYFTREHHLGLLRSPARRADLIQTLGRQEIAAAAASWKPDLVYLLAAAGAPAAAA